MVGGQAHDPLLITLNIRGRTILRTQKTGVAVKELKLSYYIGETLLLTIYIYIPIMVT